MSFLVDTDVPSNPSKLHPSAKVLAWLELNEQRLYTSAITLAELSRGVELLPSGLKRHRMEKWLTDIRVPPWGLGISTRFTGLGT